MAEQNAVAKEIEKALQAEMAAARSTAGTRAEAFPMLNIPCIAAAIAKYGVCKFTHGTNCEAQLAKDIVACL